MSSPSRIVVRAPNYLGDHVMAAPFYGRLRQAFPKAQIAIFGTSKVLGLDYSSFFDESIALEKNEKGKKLIWKNARRLRSLKFDLALSLPFSLSAALTFFLAGIPKRYGFSDGLGALFYSKSQPWEGVKAARHKSQLYLELLSLVGIEKLGLTANSLSAHGPREDLIVLAPGASISLREWPYVAEIIPLLKAQYPKFRILVVGAVQETKWSEFAKKFSIVGVEHWVGKTSIPELVSLCRRAKLVIANDSGIAHVAGTLAESPTIVLFGPGDPRYVKPLGPTVDLIRDEELACSPCESSHCRAPYGYKRCLTNITAERVFLQARRLLG